jgi:hypothetical protein
MEKKLSGRKQSCNLFEEKLRDFCKLFTVTQSDSKRLTEQLKLAELITLTSRFKMKFLKEIR